LPTARATVVLFLPAQVAAVSKIYHIIEAGGRGRIVNISSGGVLPKNVKRGEQL
jgi:hypothetical protein